MKIENYLILNTTNQKAGLHAASNRQMVMFVPSS
jgi:hypothetical protein